MFSCSSCLRRAIRVLVADHPHPHSPNHHPLAALNGVRNVRTSQPSQCDKSQRRAHSTVQSIRQGHHQRLLRKTLNSKTPITPNKLRGQKSTTKVASRDALARESNRGSLDKVTHGRQSKEEWRMQFLRDPLKLAGVVLDRLRIGDADGALELVRASEKVPVQTESGNKKNVGVENVVSWNHMMDWHMHKGDTRNALKIYNEMKKRGHRPDAHTYTIMLRGFGQNVKKPNAVKDAVGVYNSIFASNSAVTPNTIHTNAVINVCARGNDMDALWSVTGRLPENGAGAADKWTFTTVLNALQADAVARAAAVTAQDGSGTQEGDGGGGGGGGEEGSVRKIFDQAVSDGRKLWEDVIKKWRAGDVMIDEPLACAMGRLLLVSLNRRDWTDVMAMVEQTMGIKSLLTRQDQMLQLSAPAREVESVDHEGAVVGNTSQGLTTAGSDGAEKSARVMSSKRATNEFAPILHSSSNNYEPSVSTVANTSKSIYATPGNNTLSLLIEASTLLKSPAAGKAYWDLLTSPTGPYTIHPDPQNLTAYLRLLRISRASKLARDLVRAEYPDKVSDDFFKRGTFVIAMSTCVRDKNNPNVFDYASTILDVMQEKMDADAVEPKVLGMYIELAAVTTPGLFSNKEARERWGEQQLKMERQKFVPDLRENNAMRMLGRIRSDVVNINRLIKTKSEEEEFDKLPSRWRKRQGGVERVRHATMEDLAAVLRGLVGVCDRILGLAGQKSRINFTGSMKEEGWREYLLELLGQKKKLSAFLGKLVGPTNATIPTYFDKTAGQRVDAANTEPGQDSNSLEHGQDADADDSHQPRLQSDYLADVPDADAEKSIPGKRKVYRALQAGVGERQKINIRPTKKTIREEKEEKRVEKIRSQFPRSMLKPRPGEVERVERKERAERQLGRGTEEEDRTGGRRGVQRWEDRESQSGRSSGMERERMEGGRRHGKEIEENRQSQSYRGWGGGFDRLSERSGGKGRDAFVEL